MELEKLKKLHDKAYQSGQVNREEAANDLVFYYITQWDDDILSESQLGYRGEFNIVKKAGRQILSDLAANPVQVDFDAVDEDRADSADVLDGLYRTDDAKNISLEAYSNGSTESVVCGVGAWELSTEYMSLKNGDDKQVIKRRPIYEASNTVYWDPNAKLLDKSDAKYCSVLTAYSLDGYKELVKDLTGEELEGVVLDSFKQPEQSYVFPWLGGEGKKVYIVSFYYLELVKDTSLVMTDAFGQTITLLASALTEVMDELIDAGYEIESEKEIQRYQCTKYIASGAEILHECIMAGENIPVIPVYGERAYVEGEEHYEGVTRLTKDPQRLRNFQLSYLADICSRSPREKPIFLQEQIATFEDMYSETGIENNYPYLLQNRKAGDGSDLPVGPVGALPAPNIPPALIASIALSREAVADVADPGLAQDVADPDLSGKAVLALQARVDMQSMIYQEHLKHAKRRDAEVYASMASEIYDVPRKVKLTMPDGTKKDTMVMDTVIDEETGDIVTLNDISNAEFDVTSKIGPSYTSQKEQTVTTLERLISGMPPGDPMREILILKMLRLMDGVEFDDIRDYANTQLVLKGIKKPETDEEIQLLEAAQAQGEQESAEMVLAQAEMLKGEAAKMQQQIAAAKVNAEAQNEQIKRKIDGFEAQTDRMDTQVNAQKAGAEIEYKRVDAFGKHLDNQAKIIEIQDYTQLSDNELFQQAARG